MRSKSSARTPLLAATSLAAYNAKRQSDSLKVIDRTLSERNTPMPANIAFAGENTYTIYIRRRIKAWNYSIVETYQTDASGDSGRKREQHIYSWGQPLGPSLMVTANLVKFSDLVLKQGKDGTS
jgi:hypothetical protein